MHQHTDCGCRSVCAQLRFLREVKRLRDEDASRFSKARLTALECTGACSHRFFRPPCLVADTYCSICSGEGASARCSRCVGRFRMEAPAYSKRMPASRARHTTSTRIGMWHARSTSWYRSGRRSTSGAMCGMRCVPWLWSQPNAWHSLTRFSSGQRVQHHEAREARVHCAPV